MDVSPPRLALPSVCTDTKNRKWPDFRHVQTLQETESLVCDICCGAAACMSFSLLESLRVASYSIYLQSPLSYSSSFPKGFFWDQFRYAQEKEQNVFDKGSAVNSSWDGNTT